MIRRYTTLSENITSFCRFLRGKGFTTGVEEAKSTLIALRHIQVDNQLLFKQVLKTVMCKSKNQLGQFDDLYNAYWKELAMAADSKIKTRPVANTTPGKKDAAFKALKMWLHGNSKEEKEEVATYSFQECLSQKDFSSVPDEKLDEVMVLIKQLSKQLATALNRRHRQTGKAGLPDVRRMLRKNMRTGGELIELVFRKPKRNKLKVVLLCDVSKSMDLYAIFLLQFMYGFQQGYSRVETFAFSTSIQNITSQLESYNYKNALRELNNVSDSWSGGTRLGECLQSFLSAHSRSLNRNTIVIIMSDGWDTGPGNMLEQAMKVIRYKSKKIIWLNPLAGYTAYKPEVAGMRAAMPYIDVFAPVHNMESLKQLARSLK